MSFLPGPLSGGQTMQRLQSVVPQGGTRRPMLRLRRSHDRQRPHWLRLQLQGGDPYLILSNPFRENFHRSLQDLPSAAGRAAPDPVQRRPPPLLPAASATERETEPTSRATSHAVNRTDAPARGALRQQWLAAPAPGRWWQPRPAVGRIGNPATTHDSIGTADNVCVESRCDADRPDSAPNANSHSIWPDADDSPGTPAPAPPPAAQPPRTRPPTPATPR